MANRHFAAHLLSCALFACCLLTTSVLAQTDLGVVQGHVKDPQNRPIAGAAVTLRNANTNLTRTVQTDSSGDYSFLGVPLTGEYLLTVTAPQFSPAEQKEILLRAGGTAVFDFTLAIAGQKTQVNVYGTTSTVPTESNQVAVALSQEKIEDTPVLERKITTLPLLDSSVRPRKPPATCS